MALRTGHGNGAGVPRVEVLPVDELPAGVPADARPESPSDRGESGRFAPGNTLARKGGHARAGKTRLADRLGLRQLPDGSAFAPYKASAVSFRRAQCAALAASVRSEGMHAPGKPAWQTVSGCASSPMAAHSHHTRRARCRSGGLSVPHSPHRSGEGTAAPPR